MPGALPFIFLAIVIVVVLAVGIYMYVKNKNAPVASDTTSNVVTDTSNCASKNGSYNVQTYTFDSKSNACVATQCMTGYGVDIKGTPSSTGMCYAYVADPWTYTPSTDIWSPNLSNSTSSSKEDCASKCANSSTCAMAVLNKDQCYLKGKDDKAYTLSNPDSVAITKGAPPPKKSS
jgi:hypothetical protein